MHKELKHGSLRGTIKTVKGVPVADAAVLFTADSPPHPDIAALSNQDGEFRFEDLIPGTYTVLVNADGFQPLSKTVTVKTGESAELAFILD